MDRRAGKACMSPRLPQNSASCRSSDRLSTVPSDVVPLPFARHISETVTSARGFPDESTTTPEIGLRSSAQTVLQKKATMIDKLIVGQTRMRFSLTNSRIFEHGRTILRRRYYQPHVLRCNPWFARHPNAGLAFNHLGDTDSRITEIRSLNAIHANHERVEPAQPLVAIAVAMCKPGGTVFYFKNHASPTPFHHMVIGDCEFKSETQLSGVCRERRVVFGNEVLVVVVR